MKRTENALIGIMLPFLRLGYRMVLFWLSMTTLHAHSVSQPDQSKTLGPYLYETKPDHQSFNSCSPRPATYTLQLHSAENAKEGPAGSRDDESLFMQCLFES